MKPTSCAWMLLFFAHLCLGADSPATNAPARRSPLISPEVQADRKVIFRLQASNATAVAVSGEWADKRSDLEKDTNGIWVVSVGPLEPGIYGYSFTVDGLQMIDPANSQVKPMRSPRTSMLEVSGEPSMIWDFDPAIPHGAVQQHSYFSKALRKKRGLHIYTPPGYEQKRFGKYPVFFLFHGAGDNDATWTEFGRAQYILDNLIAKGKARSMVVVMTDGHAMTQTGQGTNYFLKNVQAFEDDLLNDVLPLVEKHYRVRRDPAHRAIAGLSMGGGQSLQIGLHHQEMFGWVAGFSSFVPDPDKTIAGAIEDSEQVNKRLKLLWIACGKDDFLLNNNNALDELLTQRHIKHVFKITDGKHNWPVWRRYLAELLPQLF